MFNFRQIVHFMTAAVGLAGCSSSHAQGAMQFDILCQIHGRKAVDYSADLNQGPGDNAPSKWKDSFRYAVDLEAKRYMGLDWVKQEPSKIVRLTKTRVWFSEDAGGFERYNLSTNRYYSRAHGATYMIHIVTGQCRRAPFSGFGRADSGNGN